MKKILIISSNESIIALFTEYSARNKVAMKIVNEEPARPFNTVAESVEKITKTDFDVLVIGHKLSKIDIEFLYLGFVKPEDGEGLEVLELAKDLLKNKIVISDGYTSASCQQVMNLYRKLGVRHFINRGASFADRFNNLMSCLENECNCDSL